MKLLICLVTYNRLPYTRKTLQYLWKTIDDSTEHYVIAVDNGSTDGTLEYVKRTKQRFKIDDYIANPKNYYPGKATNIGWENGLKRFPQATHLMRLDNDMALLKGWDTTAASYFEAIPELGQLGLEHSAIETPEALASNKLLTINGKTINHWPGNVGGPNIIARSVWDAGIRYDETPWDYDDPSVPKAQEDVKLSQTIMFKGWIMGHMVERLGYTFANESNWKDFKDYYLKTMEERGYSQIVEKLRDM